MKKIDQKIVGTSVRKLDEQPAAAQLPDIDPATKRIESRPEGSLNAVAEKIAYNTSEGKQKVYVLMSFLEVDGRLNGEDVSVERPIEFFFPVGQSTAEHQWISATMRSLSLAARGGFLAQNLQDLLKVSWDKGPVRCGVNRFGKPVFHASEVAAIAWKIQDTLIKRGFLDSEGSQVPTEELVRRQKEGPASVEAFEPEPEPAVTPIGGDANPESAGANDLGDCGCGQGGRLRLMDGCPTCDCGWSKC